MASSILCAIGLDDLVVDTEDDYQFMAINLGNTPSKIRALKEQLQKNRLSHPLFDTRRFAQNLESAYLKLWENYINQKESGIIWVKDVSVR